MTKWTVVAEGRVAWTKEEGWVILDAVGRVAERIGELGRAFHGRKIRITVEVLPKQGKTT